MGRTGSLSFSLQIRNQDSLYHSFLTPQLVKWGIQDTNPGLLMLRPVVLWTWHLGPASTASGNLFIHKFSRPTTVLINQKLRVGPAVHVRTRSPGDGEGVLGGVPAIPGNGRWASSLKSGLSYCTSQGRPGVHSPLPAPPTNRHLVLSSVMNRERKGDWLV